MVRVLVVDDHEVLSHSIAVALRAADFEVHVAERWSADDVLSAVTELRPDVTLLDLHLGDDATTTELIPQLLGIGTKVVLLTGSASRTDLAEAIRLGASAALQKSEPFDRVTETIRAAAEGRSAMSVTRRAELLDELVRTEAERRPLMQRFEGLTGRERAVLAHLVAGLTPAEIADTQYVAVSTVRSQLKSIYRKLGVNSQLAAAALARRAGWQPTD